MQRVSPLNGLSYFMMKKEGDRRMNKGIAVVPKEILILIMPIIKGAFLLKPVNKDRDFLKIPAREE